MNGQSADFDFIVKCTGYKIDLPFLSEELKRTILDEDSNSIKVIREIYFVDITIPKKKSSHRFNTILAEVKCGSHARLL